MPGSVMTGFAGVILPSPFLSDAGDFQTKARGEVTLQRGLQLILLQGGDPEAGN